MITAKRSQFNPDYYCIYQDGRLWRVCHEARIETRLAELGTSLEEATR